MNFKTEDGILTIFVEGNIDSGNAESVGKEIDDIMAGNPGSLVLDAENLKYISSAGLRQILRLKKKDKNLKIINVSSDVYEVFDMTGFSEMMNIEKAYRKLSVDGCEVIGEGSNGIVYRVSPDTIIKVYKNNDALPDIHRERELARTALVLGINTAIPYDVVKVGDKYGSVFELLSAKSLTKLITSDPDNKEKYVKVFADLLKEIHNTPVKEGVLPSEKELVVKWAEFLKDHLDEAHSTKLINMVNEVPESLMMLHGDYHTNNVHYANDEAILIDMDTLAVGHPIFEFGSIFNAFQGYGYFDHQRVEDFMKINWDIASYIWKRTLEIYFEGQDEAYIEAVRKKAMVIGFTRILRRTIRREPEKVEMINNVKNKLIELIDEVDTLVY